MTHAPGAHAIFLPHEIAALFNPYPAELALDADAACHFTAPVAAFRPPGSPVTPSREVEAAAG
ncbi:MAG: hypothetical protein KF886_26150 [Candidatus Hydrogenedentes bacterium]|nr:hypothetical protein [Candidatus Hydrogenedentota bacterium]